MNGVKFFNLEEHKCIEFWVSSKSLKLVKGDRTERTESRSDTKASIQNRSTTDSALNSELLNTALCTSRRFLGIGEPETEGVCDSVYPSVVRNPDDTGKGMEPHEFIRGRMSVFFMSKIMLYKIRVRSLNVFVK